MEVTGTAVSSEYVRLRVVPVELVEANAFVASLHRHHKPVVGHRFSIGCVDEAGALRGVAICGRPVARMLDKKSVLEVTRLCTDGTKNACSILYAACARVGKELGYKKVQTYILESEPGTSLVAAGWGDEGVAGGGDWNRPSRGGRRVDQPQVVKRRWAKELNK
jgi:hypothetical protein